MFLFVRIKKESIINFLLLLSLLAGQSLPSALATKTPDPQAKARIGQNTKAHTASRTETRAKSQFRPISGSEAVSYLEGLFRTKMFQKASHEKGHLIHEVIRRAGEYPFFVTEMSNHPEARLNHSSYFRVMTLRPGIYDNDPVMHDLFLLHEMSHLSQTRYLTGSELTFENWKKKILHDETVATLNSDVLVHFLIPALRPQFHIPSIWVDSYLRDEKSLVAGLSNHELAVADPNLLIQRLREERATVTKKRYHELDEQEKRFRIYDYGNESWVHAYSQIFIEAETALAQFLERSKLDEPRAIRQYQNWLDSNSENGIPFPAANHAFHTMSPTLAAIKDNPAIRHFEAECEKECQTLDQLVSEGKVQDGPNLPKAREFLKNGLSGVVYSIPYPEVKAIISEHLASPEISQTFMDRPYTRRQDTLDNEFFETYQKWTEPVLVGLSEYRHQYPTSGTMEGIKDVIFSLKVEREKEFPGEVVRIHVFEGEYEGVSAVAKAAGMQVVAHPRNTWTLDSLGELTKSGEIFYLSQPSGIDGNIWDHYDHFLKASGEAELKVLVDLAYVGTVAKPYSIDIRAPHIEAVFAGLSKGLGVYYLRIGGVYSRKQIPLLYGNIWFKNLLGLGIGTQLMNSLNVFHLPRKYFWTQSHVVTSLIASSGLPFQASDVLQLAHLPIRHQQLENLKEPATWASVFRGGSQGFIRPSLSPGIEILVNEGKLGAPINAANPEVSANRDCKNKLTKVSKR